MSNVWFTSDLHIGHAKIAQLRCDAWELNVPFDEDAEEEDFSERQIETHDAWLARKWDSRVAPDDVVWVVGDCSSGTKVGQLGALAWLNERPGHKHLIAGNHDECHPMHRDSHKWQRIYLDVFESVQMASRRRIPWDGQGHTDALISHFPYHGDHGVERYTQWRLPDQGRHFIIHGHTHSVKPYQGRQIHIGVDAWNGAPVPLSEVVAYVNGRSARGRPSTPVPLLTEDLRAENVDA